jgi:hypothetical protein
MENGKLDYSLRLHYSPMPQEPSGPSPACLAHGQAFRLAHASRHCLARTRRVARAAGLATLPPVKRWQNLALLEGKRTPSFSLHTAILGPT